MLYINSNEINEAGMYTRIGDLSYKWLCSISISIFPSNISKRFRSSIHASDNLFLIYFMLISFCRFSSMAGFPTTHRKNKENKNLFIFFRNVTQATWKFEMNFE